MVQSILTWISIDVDKYDVIPLAISEGVYVHLDTYVYHRHWFFICLSPILEEKRDGLEN